MSEGTDPAASTQLPTLVDSYARSTEPATAPPAPPRLSEGEHIGGRYRVQALLGTGGYGEVYRVFDEVDGRDRALKLHRLGTHHELARESLKGEFSLLASLSHPNLATVHDFGWVGSEEDAPGSPKASRDGVRATGAGGPRSTTQVAFFTQDLVQGLRLDRAGIELGSPRGLVVLAQLCRALDYLHSRGILHRDVKPSNILVDPVSERLTLLDFGVAQAFATDDGKVAGTFGYVAPEAITGGVLDGRADLYAVGVILFHLATGRRPFGGSVSEIVHDQLLESPPRIDPRVHGQALAHLVARLLDKDPGKRPASAGELLVALRDALGGDVELDTPDTLSSYVLSAQCVGRDAEIEILSAHLTSSARRPVLLAGDAGTGKSRLLREVRQRLQVAGVSYVGVDVHRADRGGLLAEIARAVLTPSVVSALSDDDRRELARAIPELRRPRERIAPAIDPDRAMRARREALVRALTARFAAGPGVVAIEDLHWASVPDRAALAELSERARLEGVPCTFVATARPLAESVWADAVAIELRPLDPSQSRDLVASTFGDGSVLDGTTMGSVLAREPASALWIQETLRLAVETGAIVREGFGWRAARDVPAQSLAEVLRGRLGSLERGARRLAETMAVASTPLRAVDLVSIARRNRTTDAGLAAALGELVRSGIVEDRVDAHGQRTYAMHDRFADVAREALGARRRAALHRRIGRWLLSTQDWRTLDRAARHLSSAGDHARAAKAHARAAALARRHARPADALDQLDAHERALLALGASPEFSVLLERHDLALRAGRPTEASAVLTRIEERGDEGDPRRLLEIDVRRARALIRAEREADAIELCTSAMERAEARGAKDVQVGLLLAAADAEFQRGTTASGRELALRAAAIACETGDASLEAQAWHRAAYTAVHVGLAAESVKEADLALRAARRSGDLALQSNIARQKGNALRELNRVRSAMRSYERAIDLARRGGLPELEAMAINNLGILALWLGRLDRARTALERAIELKRDTAGAASLRITLSNMVAVQVALGEYAAARELIAKVVPEEVPEEGPIIVCTSYANLAETYVAEDELETAGDLYERAYQMGDARSNWQMAGYPLHGWVRTDVMRGGALIERAKRNLPRLEELAGMFLQEQTRYHVANAMIADAEGRTRDALEAAERAYELRRTARYQWGFIGSAIETEWVRAILLARAGKRSRAERAARAAKKRLLSMTEHVASPERRATILSAPPVHRAIVSGDLDTPPGWAWQPVRS